MTRKQLVAEHKLKDAIGCMEALPNEPPYKANIKGKWYTMVQARIVVFREAFGMNGEITTELVHSDSERVVMKTTISIDDYVVSTGFAEEYRSQGMVNPQSAVENCETSAIGRALAVLGLHGGEMSSSFEMDNVISGKKPKATIVDAKYSLTSHKDSPTKLATAKTEAEFLDVCRTFLSAPKNEEHQLRFIFNVRTIVLARDNAKGKTQEAYNKLLKLYGYGVLPNDEEKTDT